MFHDLFPILTVRDVDAALGFYRDLLGATVTYRFPDAGPAAYVALDLAGSHLGLGVDPDSGATPGSTVLWVYADDCDAAVARLEAAGVVVLEPPAGTPWGERVARVADPDGHVVVVGQAAGEPVPPPGLEPGTRRV